MPKLQDIYVIFCINSIDFTQFLIGNFSNSLLIDQALIRLILFFPKHVQFNVQTLNSLSENLSFSPQFLGFKIQTGK